MIKDMLAMAHKKTAGFTIVELMVVVSVIVILAGIVLVAYPAYLTATRDNARKSDLQQIASSLKAYALKNNTYVDSTSTDGSGNGCGFVGLGNGWFSAGPNAFFPASIATCLKNAGVLSKDIVDPTGCKADGGSCTNSGNTTAYMKATCTKSGSAVTYVLAHLDGQQRRDAEVDALCDSGTVAGFDSSSQKWGTNYGMNYYVTVK
jgi:prepilin-type N-terminal cleavage/methylation domain-containing protein